MNSWMKNFISTVASILIISSLVYATDGLIESTNYDNPKSWDTISYKWVKEINDNFVFAKNVDWAVLNPQKQLRWLDMQYKNIENLADPLNPWNATNKKYVDDKISSISTIDTWITIYKCPSLAFNSSWLKNYRTEAPYTGWNWTWSIWCNGQISIIDNCENFFWLTSNWELFVSKNNCTEIWNLIKK